jgi:hypothetical protein
MVQQEYEMQREVRQSTDSSLITDIASKASDLY